MPPYFIILVYDYYMGHADSKMLTQVYIHLDKTSLRENNPLEDFIKNKLELNRKNINEKLLSNE